MPMPSRRILYLTLALAGSSVVLHGLLVLTTPHPESILAGFLAQLAFLPLYSLFSLIVVDAALARRAREDRRRRENVLVGLFYRELGESLLGLASRRLVPEGQEAYRAAMDVSASWKPADFASARKSVESLAYRFTLDEEALGRLSRLLADHRDGLLALMQNPFLLEHEGFTELLLAVSHLCEEFRRRPSLDGLPPQDVSHLEGDLRRAFVPLSSLWLSYALHLKKEYPYLYSLVLRAGPFGERPATVPPVS